MNEVFSDTTSSKDLSSGLRVAALTVVAPMSNSGMRIELAPGERIWIGTATYPSFQEVVGLSRRHASFEFDGVDFKVTDANSSNGTLVNSRLIEGTTTLCDADIITLGKLRLRMSLLPPFEMNPEAQPVPVIRDQEFAETTRYLCAAVQGDRAFREFVIHELIEEPYRAMGPPQGVDLATVAAHAVSAQRRYLLRDGLLCGLICSLLAVAATLLATDAQRAGSVATKVVLFVLPFACLVVAGVRFLETRIVSGELAQPARIIARPKLVMTSTLRQRLIRIESAQAGNVTVFSDYEPFVGAGMPFDRWSFAIDVGRGRTNTTGGIRVPKPFDAGDLYNSLAKALDATGIPGLRVEERLFVHGRGLKHYPSLLPHSYGVPFLHADSELLRRARSVNLGMARTYLSVQATGWQGQLVVTLFFRAVRLPNAVYLEGTSTALLPISREIAVVMRRPRDTMGMIIDALAGGILQTLPALLLSPFRLLRSAARLIRAHLDRKDATQRIKDGTFDYGAVTSIREKAAGLTFNRYFIEFDRDMYEKVIRERLLRHILQFLEDHDVDVSQFSGQMNNILNANTYNNQQNISGGVVGNVAGAGSHVRGGMSTSTESTT